MQSMLTIISNALCRITGRNVVSVWGLEAAVVVILAVCLPWFVMVLTLCVS